MSKSRNEFRSKELLSLQTILKRNMTKMSDLVIIGLLAVVRLKVQLDGQMRKDSFVIGNK